MAADHSLPGLLTKAADDDDDDFAADAENWQSRFNITRVSEHVFLGGAITSRKMAKALVRLGVSDVLCVAAEEADRDYEILGDLPRKRRPDLFAAYLPDEVGADGAFATPPPPGDFLALRRHWQGDIARNLFDDECWPVWYVHCHSGKHRAPIATAFLLAAETGMPLDLWVSHLSALRPEIAPWDAPLTAASARRALAALGGGSGGSGGGGADGDAQ